MALNEGDILAGKYRIERLLGEGGMGAVYVATNTVLQKRVALKVMSERFASVPAAVERFLREAVAASRVSHPSIVQVFDAGEHDGKPWIAMEMLEGESLGERLERGPMPLREVIEMADGVLSALAEVHEEGIIHRDLKPDNIFLARTRGGGSVPKVLDFGVAKDTSDGQLNKLTATGAVVGTAHYLSPEQAKGQADIDARADVYAMGVVLFETISGQMPFEAETITQLIAKMFTEDPRRLDEVAPDVPRPIADVVNTCLEQDRRNRFQTARALLGAMRAAAEAIGRGAHDSKSIGLAATAYAMPTVSRASAASGSDRSSAGHLHLESSPGVSAPGVSPKAAFPATAAGTPMPESRRATAVTTLLPPNEVPLAPSPPPKSRAGLIALVVFVFFIGAGGTALGVWAMRGSHADSATSIAASESAVRQTTAPSAEMPAGTTPQAPSAPEPPPGVEPEAVATPEPPPGADAREASEDESPEATSDHERGAARRRPRRGRPDSRDDEASNAQEQPHAQAPAETPPAETTPPPSAPRPRAGLAQSQLMGAIQQQLPVLQARCYERRLRRVPNLQGVITVAWTVRPDGRVESPNVVHNGTGDEWLARCTQGVVGDIRFPAAANGQPTPARYPFQFHVQR